MAITHNSLAHNGMEAVSLKKIGEVAEELGTTPRALRFYEEEGLIASRRTAGGIPVALIKDLATTREKFKTGQGASHGVHAILETLQATIREQIDALVRLESELSDAAKTIEGCYRCKKPPIFPCW